ncbi:MAG TPA: MarP family serine protease [Acidimicrobiales bacterium]|nr:MarP family serine protease [Acidimicrobiales bacterium]
MDGILIAVVVLSALSGFHAGAVAQTLTAAGVWVGLITGLLLVPPLAGLASGAARAPVAMLVILVCTLGLGTVGELVGVRVRRTLERRHLGTADALIGVAVGAVAALFASWVIGTVLSVSRYPSLNRALQDSSVLRAVDGVLPPLPDLFARVETYLSSRGFPVVFADLPPGLVAPAVLPDDATIQAAFKTAQQSTVKILGRACDLVESGSGFVAAPGMVVTNAHVVAGEARTQVIDSSGTHRGDVVVFDPALDVAVLRVPGLADPPLAIRERPVARDTTGAIMGYPQGGPLQATPAAVNARILATEFDIYGKAVTTRSVYELHGDVRPGNSGGPLVASGQPIGTTGLTPGTVIGLVFANSTTTAHVGYALTMDAVSADIARAERTSATTSTGSCLP